MRYFVVKKIKPNYFAIAQQYGVNPWKVKTTYLRAQNGETIVRNQRKRRSKLDGFQDIIKGKYTIVKDYCRHFRKAQTKKATIKVEHTIGLSAQVDWKEQVIMTDQNGVPHTFSIFCTSCPIQNLSS